MSLSLSPGTGMGAPWAVVLPDGKAAAVAPVFTLSPGTGESVRERGLRANASDMER
jgi:hypothetical protein